MDRFRRIIVALAATAALAGGSAVFSGVTASADYGPTHQWELEFSFNCDNPTLCTEIIGGTGGFWGWIALNGTPAGGTGDAEVTDCHHSIGGGGSAGAIHMSADVVWVNTGGMLLVFLPSNLMRPVFVAPAVPGHYDNDDIFIPQLPGVSVQLQVVNNSTSG
jgi:hypothetical protein